MVAVLIVSSSVTAYLEIGLAKLPGKVLSKQNISLVVISNLLMALMMFCVWFAWFSTEFADNRNRTCDTVYPKWH